MLMTVARFRTAFTPSGAKDDGPDAVVILTLLRTHRAQLSPLVLDTAATRELTALVIAPQCRGSAHPDGQPIDQRAQGLFPASPDAGR